MAPADKANPVAERLPATVEDQDAELDAGAGLLRPVATAGQLVVAKAETASLIAEALIEGTDFGRIPGTDRPTLFKAGAETIASAFGTRPEFEILEREVDHDREVAWKKNGRPQTSTGLYRFVVRCRLVNRATEQAVGEGLGSCSSMESKYISRPRNLENTILKMASKRALVQAVLITFGLSDRFAEAQPSLDALRGKYHALVNEHLADSSQDDRTALRHGFQRLHPELPDSSAGWDVEDFISAIEAIEKNGRRLFERVRDLASSAKPDSAQQPEREADDDGPLHPEPPRSQADLAEFSDDALLPDDGLPF